MSSRMDCVRTAAWLGCMVLGLSACGGGGGGSGGGNVPAPRIDFFASNSTIDENTSATLNWSTTNAASCSASGAWSGSQATSGSFATGALTATTTYNLSCSGAGGTAQASVTVTVRLFPTLTLTAAPTFVRAGMTSVLSWSGHALASCQASGSWSGSRPTSGTEAVGPLTQSESYVLQCAPVDGSASRGATANVAFRAGTNSPPFAEAGADRTVFAASTVRLNGSGSDDHFVPAYSAPLGFAWVQTGGPAVTLAGANTQNASFVAPLVAVDTVLTFALTVTDDEGASSAPDSLNVTVRPVPPTVTISGFVRYEHVPTINLGSGLSYNNQQFVALPAEVLIELLNAGTQGVIASGRVVGGAYQFTVPSATDVALRVTAELSRQAPDPLPHWQIVVRDLDANGAPLGAVYSYTGPTFSTAAGVTTNLEVPSGWNAAGQLVGPRHAAPFAILAAVRGGLSLVVGGAPSSVFPALTIDWSPTNSGGQTFYSRTAAGRRIVLAGEVNVDTDEYDRPVIVHEFGHYVHDAFSRSDSTGGPHTIGDRLDPRLAFGEGFATAFAAMAFNDSIYFDTFGPNQANMAWFGIEGDNTLNEGWYSESSVQEIIWDLFDSASGGPDLVQIGFGQLWDVMTAAVRDTDAVTSLFPFLTALKQLRPSDAAAIDTLLVNEQIIGATIDAYGSTETNNAGSPDVLPIFTNIAVGGGPVQLRSTNAFGTPNKLSSHRFLRLNLPAASNVRFNLTAASGRDPDIEIFRRGVSLGPDQGPADEDFVLALGAGEYVLDVFDCGNAGCNSNVSPGVTDLTITLTPN